MKTRIYYADTKVLEDESLFKRIYERSLSSRKEKIDRMKFDKDKRLSLAAGYLLDLALGNEGIREYSLEYGEHEKPYVDGYEEVFFNLSHSGERAMCIVGGCQCGCDVEKIRDIDLRLSKRFFAPSEHDRIMKADNSEREFFRLWTLKESFMKASGEGFGIPLGSFEIYFNEGVPMVRGKEEYSFFEYDMGDGYSISCCIRGESKRPELSMVDFE